MPLVAAVALIAVCARRLVLDRKAGRRIAPSDVAWLAPHVLLLAVVAAFAVSGHLDAQAGRLEIAAYSLVVLACGLMVLARRRVGDALDGLSRGVATGLRVFIACTALIAVSLASAWVVDFAWMESIGGIQLQFFSVTALLFLVVSTALYFLGQRTGALVAVVPLCAVGFGIAQHFVVMFKGTPIMPMDLLSLKTAGAIAAGYEYVLTSNMVRALCVTALSLCALSYVRAGEPHASRKVRVGVSVASVCTGFVLIVGLATFFNGAKLEERLGVSYDRWMPITTYQTLGFVPAFIEVAQDFAIPVPDAYDKAEAEELIAQLAAEFDATLEAAPERVAARAQFDELKPTVIGIMNETFADMSIYDEIYAAGYEGPYRYNSLPGAFERGPLMVSVFGGGTANSEFEFLTGNSTAFIGTGKYPYQLYDMSSSDSLVKQFEGLGYTSLALHPQDPVNWKRSSVYEQLGFDEFLSISSFEGAPWYHSGVTDAATYEQILQRLAQSDAPQFIFDVTMQNHGGYAEGSVPAEDVVQLEVAGASPEAMQSLGTYLACIERADMDLAWFIEQLQALGRPVVLVFFGDHQPGLDESLYAAMGGGLDAAAFEQKKFETTYLMWSNYEVAGAASNMPRAMGTSQLAANMLYTVGAPLTDRQKADLMLGQQVGALSLTGYTGADGIRYALDAQSPWTGALNDLCAIQYARFVDAE